MKVFRSRTRPSVLPRPASPARPEDADEQRAPEESAELEPGTPELKQDASRDEAAPPAPAPPDPNAITHTRPLAVALDVRPWEMSGLGTYVRELLNGAARLDLPIAWTLIGPPALREAMPEGLTITRWVEFDRPLYHPGATLGYPRTRGQDVFHYPHYNYPWWRGGRRTLVTVFDLFHLHYGSFPKRRYQAHFLRRLRWGRASVMTASEKTAMELVHEAGVARGRIQVVALGGGRRPAPLPEQPEPVRALSGQPLTGPWLLAVGIDQPHKNFDFLLSALGLYYQRRPDAPPLVWTGPSAEACQRRARALPASLRDRIALEPPGDAGRLERLYRGASMLLFPSLDEGFGLPPLEAMTRGVPVVCSRREPMMALLGAAPLYFEPTESASLWRVIDRLLDVPGIRQEVVRRGYDQAAQYDWDRCVRETFEAYARVAGRPILQ